MSKIKTVEHNGEVLQIGQRYDFSDDGNSWVECRLMGVSKNSIYLYGTGTAAWKLMRAINPIELGTITKAPVDLVHGAAYSFVVYGTSYVGLYSMRSNQFSTMEYDSYDVANATSIKPLTVEIE